MSPWIYVFLLLIFAFVLKLISGKTVQKKKVYYYTLKDELLSKPEREIYNLLLRNFGKEYAIFPQVQLSKFLDEKIKGQSWKYALYHINSKSVDYVICHHNTSKPLVAIELDDRSHQRKDRIDRDKEVERILESVGLPLIRIENHGSFDENRIVSEIWEKLV